MFVSGEVVYSLKESGDDIVATHVEGEFDHNFSVNHDVKDASEALGAGGCNDCHSEGAALFETMQVVNVTGYLAESYKDKVEPYAEPAWKFQGYDASRAAELTSEDIGNDDDDGCFVQTLDSLTAVGFGAWLTGLLTIFGTLSVIGRR